MSEFKPFFQSRDKLLPSCAIFMSGKGTNAENVIRFSQESQSPSFMVKVLVTDRPKSSNTLAIGEKYNIPVVSVGLKSFYRENGLDTTSLATDEGRRVRKLWSEKIISELREYDIDFGVLAGFEPLCDVMEKFPCLNVHPGDLTFTENDERVLTGLHTVPVERAIRLGHVSMRSSVILAQPFGDDVAKMDSGHILGISDEVGIDLLGHSPEELEACAYARPEKRPKGGFDDILEKVAEFNLQKLKEGADWEIFPQIISDFAAQKFCHDESGTLFYRMPEPLPITTIVYGNEFREIVFALS